LTQLVDFLSSFDLRFRAARATLRPSRSSNVGSALSLVNLLSWVEGFLPSSCARRPGSSSTISLISVIAVAVHVLFLDSACIVHFHFLCAREPLQPYPHKLCRSLHSILCTPSYFSSIKLEMMFPFLPIRELHTPSSSLRRLLSLPGVPHGTLSIDVMIR
jgi:hypothetical protein